MSNYEDPNDPFPMLTEEDQKQLDKKLADYVPELIVISEVRMQ